MFRKKKTILERSLIREGVDICSDVAKTLLGKMVECGYSDDEIYLEWDNEVSVLLVHQKGSGAWVASIKMKEDECHGPNVQKYKIWWPYEPGGDVSSYRDEVSVYSEFDVWGKSISDVQEKK